MVLDSGHFHVIQWLYRFGGFETMIEFKAAENALRRGNVFVACW
jgi:hypothetical protein